MRKLIVTFAAAVSVLASQSLFIGGASAATFELSPTNAIRILSSKGTNICTIGAFGESPSGTKYALTAGHCAKFSDSVVTDARGVRIGRVIASRGTDRNLRDIGHTIIRLDGGGRIHAGIVGARNPRVGDRIHFKGYATDWADATVTTFNDPSWFQYNIDSSPGDSGGPVWVDSYSGSVLVGFVLSHTDGYEEGQAVPVNYFLASARRDVPGLKILIKG